MLKQKGSEPEPFRINSKESTTQDLKVRCRYTYLSVQENRRRERVGAWERGSMNREVDDRKKNEGDYI